MAKKGTVTKINEKLAEKAKQKAEEFTETPPEELAGQEGRGEEAPPPVLIQGELPGQETPKLVDVIRAAEDYRKKRDKRMDATKEEVAAQALLLGIMDKHMLTEYHFEGLVVKKEQGKIRVTVRVETGDEDDGD